MKILEGVSVFEKVNDMKKLLNVAMCVQKKASLGCFTDALRVALLTLRGLIKSAYYNKNYKAYILKNI